MSVNNFKLKFAANLSTMFTEVPDLTDRYIAAKEAGFKAVECQFPYEYELASLVEAKKASGLEHVLINSFPGDMENGEFGFACIPGRRKEFKRSLQKTLEYAKALECRKVHLIAGMLNSEFTIEEQEKMYVRNLKYAAELFEENNIVGLIEPLCPEVKPSYFLSHFLKAIKYIRKVDSANLKLLLDVYHLQMLEDGVRSGIIKSFPYSGHVQISQAPGRNEPSFSGKINFKFVFSLFQTLGYTDYIGLEYYPSGNTKESLSWIQEFKMQL